jgi:hypothetical protein
MVHSPDRILYPMRRVNLVLNGVRNPQKRVVSGYERISWDEALDVVASEINRVRRELGKGAILSPDRSTTGVVITASPFALVMSMSASNQQGLLASWRPCTRTRHTSALPLPPVRDGEMCRSARADDPAQPTVAATKK